MEDRKEHLIEIRASALDKKAKTIMIILTVGLMTGIALVKGISTYRLLPGAPEDYISQALKGAVSGFLIAAVADFLIFAHFENKKENLIKNQYTKN